MRDSPLRQRLESNGATTSPYGPPGSAVDVIDAVDALELEYAALRKAAAIFDEPHRGVLEVRGGDRTDFLQRMVTQDVRELRPFSLRRSFWLNRKGRIDADLRLIGLEDRIIIDLDVHSAASAVESLSSYLFTEDVLITDVSEERHRLALHGPGAAAALAEVSSPVAGPTLAELGPDLACVVRVGDAEIVVAREDWCGETGLELVMEASAAADVFDALLSLNPAGEPFRPRVRPVGWHALNVARIETGTPVFNLDFGTSSVPAETSLLHDRVSFTKGCYLGQEIVARMHALGRPKQVIVALRPAGDVPRDERGQALMPVTGAQVCVPGEAGATPVGAVSSATLSPMLGAIPICLATVRQQHGAADTKLVVAAEGRELLMRVQDGLRFWPRPVNAGESPET